MSPAPLADLLADPRQARKVIDAQALEHMQQYIEDIRDELKWNESFGNSQSKLIAAARQAREEILQGKATPMDVEAL